jgi:hypothetical protein
MKSRLLNYINYFFRINMTVIAYNFVFDSILIIFILITMTADTKALFVA